jgi:hypothetical protein
MGHYFDGLQCHRVVQYTIVSSPIFLSFFPILLYAVLRSPSRWLHLRPLSYGPPWAHYLSGYQDRLLGGPLGLPDLRCTTPAGMKHKDYRGEVLE